MEDILYRALMLGRNKKVAREEFLSAVGKKEPASFDVEESGVYLNDVITDRKVCVHIRLINEGYLEILANCTDKFVQFNERLISTDEAADGWVEVCFTILAGRLHKGKNFGEITFSTPYKEIRIPIIINNRIKIPGESPRVLLRKITDGYLDFRTARISQNEWQDSVFALLDTINGNSAADLFLMLYKAHVLCIADESEGAQVLLEYVSGELEKRQEGTAELRCYYLYVNSLFRKDEEVSEEALISIRKLYEENPSWRLLWLLFYMDEEYDEDTAKKTAEIKRLFAEGKCSSPVMFFEAFDCYRKNPELITGLSDFELSVLNFAIKRGIPDTAVSLRVSDIVLEMTRAEYLELNTGLTLKILKDNFDRYPVNSVNNAIASLLVFTDSRKAENHCYYDRAVFNFADIPGLYNYYIFSMGDDPFGLIPERILKYFAADASSLFDRCSCFYANIIKNRYENYAYKTAYEACKDQMAAYAYNCAAAGKNDEFLDIIYGEVLQMKGSDPDFKRAIFRTVSARRLTCTNPAFKWVIVFHRELKVYQDVLLEGEGGFKSALVNIYSPDALILFRDGAGNIYKNVPYELKTFEHSAGYARSCIADIPVNSIMLTGGFLSLAKEIKEPEEILDFLLSSSEKSAFTKEYEEELICALLEYYASGPVTDSVYKKLMGFLGPDAGDRVTALLTEFIIEKKRYNEAYEKIKEYGFEKIKPETLASFTHVMVQLHGDEKEDLLLDMCVACIRAKSSDREIIRYLCRYYDGPLDVLLDIYEKSSACGVYNLNVAGRILSKAMETESEPEILPLVFARCYEEDEDRTLIKDFLEYSAARYLFGESVRNLSFFEYIGNELHKGTAFSDRTKTAFLFYMKDRENIPPKLLKKLQEIINGLVYKGIMLEEFKAFGKFFRLPGVLVNSHIEAVLVPGVKEMDIEYEISSPSGSFKGSGPMEEIFPGCFAKYFTLFYGETLSCAVRGGKRREISFSDMKTEADGSRFSAVDELVRLGYSDSAGALADALSDYYVMNELIEKLF